MSDNLKNTILRFAVIFVVIVMLFGVVLFQIGRLQTVERSQWESIADKFESVTKPIPATRGNIYDADGRLLASSIPQYSVHIDTRVEALHMDNGKLFWENVDSIADGLSRIIGDKSPQEYKWQMVTAYKARTNRERDIRLYRGRISYIQKKEIQQLPLVRRGYYKSGFHYEDLHRRVKPFGSLGSRTIGSIYGEGGHGNAGIEKRFDAYLCGEDGVSVRQPVAGKLQYVPVKDAVNGCDVYTTLDANLMDICESALRQRLHKTEADWGCVALMEVSTGEIKAMCNLDRAEDGTYYEAMNHVVSRVEPGSTFKTIALMAALDDGKIDIDDTVEVYRKGWTYYNARHTDSHPRDTVYSIRNALAVSSNIAMAKIITEGYKGSARKFVHKLDRMGLLDSVDYIIPGADQARIDIPNDTVTISRMSYGYSVEMSPMQTMLFYNGIANGGKMISPVLVREVRKNGKTIKTYQTETIESSICGSSTLRDIQSCLHDVVWDNHLGTASVNPWKMKKAQSDLVHIAGKTGTAQLFEKGRYQSHRHRMSFVGYFPEENPQYTCICVISGPKYYGYYDAGMDCGSVVRQIAEKTMVYAAEYVIVDGEKVLQIKNEK